MYTDYALHHPIVQLLIFLMIPLLATISFCCTGKQQVAKAKKLSAFAIRFCEK